MKQELQERLYDDFPLLYEDRSLPMTATCMCWGICCGDGWFDILYDLSSKLYPLIEKIRNENDGKSCYSCGSDKEAHDEHYTCKEYRISHPRAAQVKEKMGTLRFYMNNANDEMYELINKAEKQSEVTCEVCGKTGKHCNSGWIFTLCDSCDELNRNDHRAFVDKLQGR